MFLAFFHYFFLIEDFYLNLLLNAYKETEKENKKKNESINVLRSYKLFNADV